MSKTPLDAATRTTIEEAVQHAMGLNDGSVVLVKNRQQKAVALSYLMNQNEWEAYVLKIKIDPVAEVGTIEPSALSKAEKKKVADYQRQQRHLQAFNVLHEKGSAEYPQKWAGLNYVVAATAQRYLDVTDPTVKAMLTDICYTLLKREGNDATTGPSV